MAVSWEFYSKRRRTTLQKFMVDNNVSRYDDFVKCLVKLGVNPPTQKLFDSLYVTHSHDVPVVKSVELSESEVFTEKNDFDEINTNDGSDEIQHTEPVSDDKLLRNLFSNNLKRIGSNKKKSKIIDQPEFRIDEDIDGSDNVKNARDER